MAKRTRSYRYRKAAAARFFREAAAFVKSCTKETKVLYSAMIFLRHSLQMQYPS